MNIEQLRSSDCILFEAISGSRAYGLDTPESDTDIRGVFIQPRENLYGFSPLTQINDEACNVVFYEIGRFMELLVKNNPTVLELLYTPADCILYESKWFSEFRNHTFLSKQCEQTFVNYALGQLKKTRGLHKKIVNPMDKEKKSPLDFCVVVQGSYSKPLVSFLEEKGINQKNCGLSELRNVKDGYALYVANEGGQDCFRGIVHDTTAHDLCLSRIPKGLTPEGILFLNRDGYKVYNKKYREYWEWVEKRNPERYTTNQQHGQGYDSKNMMHVFRLLIVARGIAERSTINLRGHDRDFLLKVKAGAYSYGELMKKAQENAEKVSVLFAESSLPEVVDKELIERLLIEVREFYYK